MLSAKKAVHAIRSCSSWSAAELMKCCSSLEPKTPKGMKP